MMVSKAFENQFFHQKLMIILVRALFESNAMIYNAFYWATIGKEGQFYAAKIVEDNCLDTLSVEPTQIAVEPIKQAWPESLYYFTLESKTGKYYTFDCTTCKLHMILDATTVEMVGVSNDVLYWYAEGILHVKNSRIPCEVCPRYVCCTIDACLFDCGDKLKFYCDGVLQSVPKDFPVKPIKECCLSIFDRRAMGRNEYYELFSVLYKDGEVWISEDQRSCNYVSFDEDGAFEACPPYAGLSDHHERIVCVRSINDFMHYYMTETGSIYSRRIEGDLECIYHLDAPITEVLSLFELGIIYVTGCRIVYEGFEGDTETLCSFEYPIVSTVYRNVFIVQLSDGSVHKVDSGNVSRYVFFDSHPLATPKPRLKNARSVV